MELISEKFYSAEAERAVLGGILIDGTLFDEVSSIIDVGDFFVREHKNIFSAMVVEIELGRDLDVVDLGDYLDKSEPIDGSWVQELAIMAKETISTVNIKRYAEKVKEYAVLRDLFSSSVTLQGILKDADSVIESRLSKAQDFISSLFDSHEQEGPKFVRDMAKEYIEHVERCHAAKDGITGLSTGFENIDSRTSGFHPGDFVVLAARPSMGKSTMALNIAKNISYNQNLPVLYFSLEMVSMELMGRLVADFGRINYSSVRKASFEDEEWPRFNSAVAKFKEAPLIIDESTDLTIAALCARARQVHRKNKLSLIVVDHIGLLEAEGENETIKLGKISRGLKNLAKQLNIPILGLSQLNRECEKRPNKRPIMSDLRQSGAIEQDATAVCFIYRDVVYNESTPYPYFCELIWRKLRSGEIGTDYFATQFHQCRFQESYMPDDYMQEEPPKKSRGMQW